MSFFHDRAVILSTGDEIIVGQLQDTNARWLAQQLVSAGIMPIAHEVVPDDLPALVAALRRACAAAPLVVMSGGLGPTEGDLTRQALAALTGDELVDDAEAHAAITAMLAKRGREMSERQARQAQRPAHAMCLPNAFGTAPGLHVVVDGKADVMCLPGPPGELRPMFAEGVRPLLRPPPGRTVLTRLCHIVGVPEAECVARLGDLTKRDRVPLVGITASGGILTLRIRYEGPGDGAAAGASVDEAEATARRVLGDNLFATGGGAGIEELVRTVLRLLKERGETVSVVESCTGGMLGELLSTVAGASASFVGGTIAYANAAKEAMGVPAATLEAHGAVSAPCCAALCSAGLRAHGADHVLVITGIAGPDGGTDGKPVGTVFIGRASLGQGPADVRRFLFTGDREDVRRRACVSALAMLYFSLRGLLAGEPELLWQVRV
ncbi:MAG: CinA family nicotinamide mononucleotide deamidase-related protein [Phycisphaerales bacterium]